MADLVGKVVWISGGTRMGAAIAQRFLDAGGKVVLTWRSSRQSTLDALKSLKGSPDAMMDVHCDVADTKSIQDALAAVDARFKRLDILVNLASIYETTPADLVGAEKAWENHLNANAKASYLLTLAAAPALAQSGSGRVVLISDWTSASGRPRYPEYDAYYISKLAVKGVVESLALRFAPKVLVNGIAPGPMIPPPSMSAKETSDVENATPLKRWGGAEEMAKTVQFLAETDFMTGETVRLDGGRHLI